MGPRIRRMAGIGTKIIRNRSHSEKLVVINSKVAIVTGKSCNIVCCVCVCIGARC